LIKACLAYLPTGTLLVSPVQILPVNTLLGSVVLSNFIFNGLPLGAWVYIAAKNDKKGKT